jgi:hypothetical protein
VHIFRNLNEERRRRLVQCVIIKLFFLLFCEQTSEGGRNPCVSDLSLKNERRLASNTSCARSAACEFIKTTESKREEVASEARGVRVWRN